SHPQKETANHRQIDKGENSRKPLHRNALCLAWWFPDKIWCFAWEKFFENFGAQIELRRILIVTKGDGVGVIRALQLRFDIFVFVLLHEEKIAIEIRWHVASFIVADSIEIAYNPRKRINAGSNQMSCQMIVRW